MKLMKRISILCMAVMLLVFLPMQAEAATVKLNKAKCTVYAGKTVTLKINGTSQKVTWSSSDKKIAMVSNAGKVTAKKAGKATITAKVGKKSYKCVVTVKSPYLNKTKQSLYVGKNCTLKLTGTTAKKWTSSNTKVATVSSKGKVTTKAAGSVTITCKGADGKAYKCKINVKNPYLNKTKQSLHQGDSDTLKITGTTAQTWTSSNNKVATVSSTGKVTALKAGKATITCKGANGKSYKCVITVEGHSYTKEIITEASCTTEGLERHTCACGDSYEETISILGHEWEDVIEEATCEQEGTLYQRCTNCGVSEFVMTLPMVEHDYEEIIIVEPTCADVGEICYRCRNCLFEFNSWVFVEHEYREIEVEATCGQDGGLYGECVNCGKRTLYESRGKLPHDYTSRTVEPTCQSGGGTLYECKNCDESYYGDDYVSYIDHNYEYEVLTEPDCNWDGEGANVCTMCGEVEWGSRVDIESPGHAYKGRTIETGRLIECERCASTLMDISWKSEDGYLSTGMVVVDGEQISMMPGTTLEFEIKAIDPTYYYEYFYADLAEGECQYDGFGNLNGRADENVSLSSSLRCFSASEKGTNQLLFTYEGKVIDRIDITVEGDTLIEAFHKYANGDTAVLECFQKDFRQMLINANQVINQCITEEMTDCEKVKAIQDWIIDNIEYESSATYNGQRAVIALVDGQAVCAGYAETFMFFMDLLDIPCYNIYGWGDKESHAWNMVQMDTGNGKGLQWYYVDTTWGASYCEFDTTVAEWNAKNGDGVWSKHEAVTVEDYNDWSYLLSSGGQTIWSVYDDEPFPQ